MKKLRQIIGIQPQCISDILHLDLIVEMGEDIVLAFSDVRIFINLQGAFLLGVVVLYHLGVFKFRLIEQVENRGNIPAFFDFLDIGVAERIGKFCRHPAPDGSAAGKGNDYNAPVFRLAQRRFCQGADLAGIILFQTPLQLDQIPLFNAAEFPIFLIIGVVMPAALSVFKDKPGEIFVKILFCTGIDAVQREAPALSVCGHGTD